MSKLFGTSGLRGLANVSINPLLAMKVGYALASYSKAKDILTGCDTRTTSPMLHGALASGAVACGSNILQNGIIPTPALAYLTMKLKAGSGAMITASHNLPEYNGIKLYNQDSTAFSNLQQNEIEKIINSSSFKLKQWHKIGNIKTIDETQKYIELITDINLKRKWKIIIDPGNGATSILAPKIFQKLDCNVIAINSQPDGHFPGRGPGVDEESIKYLSELVKLTKAELAIAYDGDGDRMVTVDNKGQLTPLDQLFAAYALYKIKNSSKNKKVVTHIETSMCVEEVLNLEGGKVKRTKVGDVYITETIKKQKALFGGEPCGAWIHPSFHFCPDGILSSVLLLKALEENNQKLSEFVSGIPLYPILREQIKLPKIITQTFHEKYYDEVINNFPIEVKEHSNIDGLRLKLREGWILIRPSGTEPVIRVTVEAKTSKDSKFIMQKTMRLLIKLVKE